VQTLKSQLDASVNFVEQQLTGFIEARYVRRTPEYFIAYLSSQTGCNRGCRMCHLTATRQTGFTNLDQQEFVSQLETVLAHYERDAPAQLMHVNFMARGETMANPTITETGTELLWRLGGIARERDLKVKFNISTIMPKTLRKPLTEVFPIITPTIYYSIYSVDDEFRAQWLPAAMPVDMALKSLKEYQRISKKIVKFHCAFIKDQNDSEQQVENMMQRIKQFDIRGEFNIVRYNPYSAEQGVESDRVKLIQQQIEAHMPVKIIPRVGFDAKASCGMFVSK
jgi:23S rRNA (adenine2503-C2)-methyltransferase